MALPRSTVPGAVDKTTGQKFAMAVPSIATLTSGSVTVNLSSRKFAAGESTVGWFDVQENGGGLVIDGVGPVIGNKPTYTCTVYFFNPTGGTIAPATRNVWLAQE